MGDRTDEKSKKDYDKQYQMVSALKLRRLIFL